MPTVEELRETFSSKRSEQLLEIIRSPKDWSEEAVEAARQCLIAKGTEIPAGTPQSQNPLNTSYANLFDRFIAAIIDSFIISISVIIIALVLFWETRCNKALYICCKYTRRLALLGSPESSSRMATIGEP